MAAGGPGLALARAVGWWRRLAESAAHSLPLLLMALLAAGTWWLARHTPQPPSAAPPAPPRQTPDYTMQRFSITRFDASGRAMLRIEGQMLRHYPARDQLEIDEVRVLATHADGRRTEARARRALVQGDASEIQLMGDASVSSVGSDGQPPLRIDSQFLHADVQQERLRTHLPVTVRQGRHLARAGGLDYQHAGQLLQLLGPVRIDRAAGA